MRSSSRFVVIGLVAGFASSARAGVTENGVQMNGVQMNGVQMNGVQMNGVQMNGVQMNGVQMNGVQMNGVQMSGTWLTGNIIDSNSTCAHSQRVTGTRLNGCSPCAKVVATIHPYCATSTWDQQCVNDALGVCIVGADKLVGATFVANTNRGPVPLRLTGVALLPDPAPVWRRIGRSWFDINQDVWAYNFQYWDPTRRGSWKDLCPYTDKDNFYNAAIPVAGQWADCDHDKSRGCGGKISDEGFTLACNDVGAIAKCVQRMQYKPWSYAYEQLYDQPPIFSSGDPPPPPPPDHYQSLEKFHEACVRMVRGDYCGDGTAHTGNGTLIDVWDHTGTQKQTANLPGFTFEAGWNPEGASCVGVTRYQTWGGSMTATTPYTYPDQIKDCPELAPIRIYDNGQIAIIDGCGNFYNINPSFSDPMPTGYVDWPRTGYYLANDHQ